MKIILTGATGLIGSRFEELMFENHEIIPASSKDVNLSVEDTVWHFFEDKEADVVIHLAGKTDVDGCERDKKSDEEKIGKIAGTQTEIEKMNWGSGLDWLASDSAFALNFLGTKFLYEIAKEKGIKFVYISTDFVFDGNGKFLEDSEPNPINWYGMTKYYGERLIDVSSNLIVRLSFPYGYKSPVKKDFVWKLIDLLRDKDEVSLIEDQTITPTFIDDIVNGLNFLISKNATGIYHLTGSSFEDPYEIGQKIKDAFGFSTKINAITRDEFYKGRAPRPFQSIMKNDKLVRIGFKPKTFDQGLNLIKNS